MAMKRLTKEQRQEVLGDENLIYPPTENLCYDLMPKDALAFGAMGVDGVHYLILKINGKICNESPVIYFSPMDFAAPYALLGHTFLAYLATACGVTEIKMREVLDDEKKTGDVLAKFLRMNFSHSRIDLDGFGLQINDYSHLLPVKNP